MKLSDKVTRDMLADVIDQVLEDIEHIGQRLERLTRQIIAIRSI